MFHLSLSQHTVVSGVHTERAVDDALTTATAAVCPPSRVWFADPPASVTTVAPDASTASPPRPAADAAFPKAGATSAADRVVDHPLGVHIVDVGAWVAATRAQVLTPPLDPTRPATVPSLLAELQQVIFKDGGAHVRVLLCAPIGVDGVVLAPPVAPPASAVDGAASVDSLLAELSSRVAGMQPRRAVVVLPRPPPVASSARASGDADAYEALIAGINDGSAFVSWSGAQDAALLRALDRPLASIPAAELTALFGAYFAQHATPLPGPLGSAGERLVVEFPAGPTTRIVEGGPRGVYIRRAGRPGDAPRWAPPQRIPGAAAPLATAFPDLWSPGRWALVERLRTWLLWLPAAVAGALGDTPGVGFDGTPTPEIWGIRAPRVTCAEHPVLGLWEFYRAVGVASRAGADPPLTELVRVEVTTTHAYVSWGLPLAVAATAAPWGAPACGLVGARVRCPADASGCVHLVGYLLYIHRVVFLDAAVRAPVLAALADALVRLPTGCITLGAAAAERHPTLTVDWGTLAGALQRVPRLGWDATTAAVVRVGLAGILAVGVNPIPA